MSLKVRSFHCFILFPVVIATIISTRTSAQETLTVTCSTRFLGTLWKKFVMYLQLSRNLYNNEKVEIFLLNGTIIGTCRYGGCSITIVDNGNFRLSFSHKMLVLHVSADKMPDNLTVLFGDTSSGYTQSIIIDRNKVGTDTCSSHHFTSSPLHMGESTTGLTTIDEEDPVTDINVTERSKVSEPTVTESLVPANIANFSQIAIPLMFTVVMIVSVLLLTFRLLTCLIQDKNCCKKTHSFQPSENVYRIYETVQNNANIETVAIRALQTPSLPRSVIHSIESDSIGRLLSVEVNLDGIQVDVEEERPPVPPRNGLKSAGESVKQQSKTDSKLDVEFQEKNRSISNTETSSIEMDSEQNGSAQEMPNASGHNSGHDSINDLEACLRSELETSVPDEEPEVNGSPNAVEEPSFDRSIDEFLNSPQYDTLCGQRNSKKISY